MARTFITAPILVMLAVIAASAQIHVDDLRTRLEPRFEIVPIANGIVLTPRFRTSIRSVELSDSTIAIDGAPVTGRELRDRLGDDADLVLQVSYLDAAARRSLAAGKTAAAEAGRADSANDRSRSHGATSAAHATRAAPRRHRSHRRLRDGGQR